VICGACGNEAPAGSAFCNGCGAKLVLTCASCGATPPPGSRFCNGCGASLGAAAASTVTERVRPLSDARDPRSYTPKHLADRILRSKSALEGERKQVTVLFADVKGSMELAGQLDPEVWHAILERFFEILTEGVHRFEGTVNQYTGDGIMALFGAPIAHEDHAHRACYAALHLAQALKEYADGLRVEHGLNFAVRMGINSGEVVVGKIGDDLRMDYTAQGHTVGLAQRMEALADSGRAMLAEATIDLVQGYFALRDLGVTKVKGVDGPVRVAELEGLGRMRTRLDRSRARGLSKFVGRDEEMERLETALRRSLQGDGQVVGVMAEAGSGKSRLCFEFLERCRARNIIVRTATGVPHGRAVPLQPILEFYREIFGATNEDTEAQVRQKIAGSLAQIAPEELPSLPLLFDFMRVPDPTQPAPELDPEERLRELVGVLRRITAARSRREPAVLVFEDMHWVDPDTETIVDALVDAAGQTRTLVLLNFRPEYLVPWAGRTHYQQIALRPLDEAAAALLLEDWLGNDPSLASFVALVCRSTGGNPFFMEEVVQAQIESGALVGTRGRFLLSQPIESVEVPASVNSLLAARIDRLDESAKDLLQTAAVIGDEVPEALLERVSRLDRAALRGSVRGLVQSEFLYEAVLYPESEYAFKHPLTREVAYASLLSERRRSLHASVAKALEALAGEAIEQRAALIAHHWEEAGEKLEAARWQGRAATRARMNLGESSFHWRKVTELLVEATGPEARALLAEAQTRLVYAAGRSGATDGEVAQLFEEARATHGGTDSPEHVLTLASYAIIRHGAGAAQEARRLLSEAVAMARRLGDPSALAGALGASALMYLPNEFPEEHDVLREEVDRLCASDASLGEDLFGFRANVIVATMGLMSPTTAEGVDEALMEASRRVEGTTQPLHLTLYHFSAAQLKARRGDVGATLEHGRQARDAAIQGSNTALQVLGGAARALGLLGAARLDEARQVLEPTLALGVRVQQPVTAMWCYPLLAELELREGHLEAAGAAAERGIEIAQAMGLRHSEAKNRIQLARALIARGDVAGAEAEITRGSELAEAVDAHDLRASLAAVRAERSTALGDAEGAARAWVEAARLHRDRGEEWLAALAAARIPS